MSGSMHVFYTNEVLIEIFILYGECNEILLRTCRRFKGL